MHYFFLIMYHVIMYSVSCNHVFEILDSLRLSQYFTNIPAGPRGPGGPAKKVSKQITKEQIKYVNQRPMQLLLTGFLYIGVPMVHVS